MTSSDICAVLRERYKQPEWSLFFEVANGTGANTKRHADALAMNMYPSRGLSILGFEIKVSRSDLKRELDNPNKAEEIAQFCDEWWLVVPKGLIRADDNIPIPWGVIECDGGNLKVTKKAQALEPKPVTKSFMAAVLRSAGKVDEATILEAKQQAYNQAWERHEERVKQEVERVTKNYKDTIEKIADFEKITGHKIRYYTNMQDLAERISIAQDLEKIYGHFGSLQSLKRMAEKFIEDVSKLNVTIKEKAVS